MARIISKARQLRLTRSAQLGRPITLQEVADQAGIERAALNRIELGKTRGVEFDTLIRLCTYYGVGVGDLLEFDPGGETRGPMLGAVSLAPA